MRQSHEGTSWLRAVLAVREPIQFVALAYGCPCVVLLAAMWNSQIVSTLDKDGMLCLTGMMAFVQVSVLLLYTRIVPRASGDPQLHRVAGAPASPLVRGQRVR